MTPTDRPSRRPKALLAMAAWAALAACGCGGPGDGYTRFPVRGTVQHDGTPLKTGTITFIPEGAGAAGVADVADGAFALSSADGLSPGAYRVEVYSVRPTGRKVPSADDPAATVDETVNVVDRRYNVASTLRVEVPPRGPGGPFAFKVASPGAGSSKANRR